MLNCRFTDQLSMHRRHRSNIKKRASRNAQCVMLQQFQHFHFFTYWTLAMHTTFITLHSICLVNEQCQQSSWASVTENESDQTCWNMAKPLMSVEIILFFNFSLIIHFLFILSMLIFELNSSKMQEKVTFTKNQLSQKLCYGNMWFVVV